MRLLRTIAASVALIGFAATQSPEVLAQGANPQTGASTSQSSAGGQVKGSVNVSARGSAASGRSAGGHADNSGRTGVRSESSHTKVGVGSGSETTIRGRSQTRVGVSSGSREDIVLRRKRAPGVVVYNDELERHVIIKKRRHPSIAVAGEKDRIITRRHGGGGDINVRTSVRSQTKSGSANPVNRGQSSASEKSKGSGPTRGAAASQSGGNARTTTGLGTSR
jgi:hypothetical protein